MPPAAVADHRELIRRADANVERQQQRLEEVARGLDADPDRDALKRFAATAKGWVVRFNRDLPNSLAPEAQNEIRDHLIGGVETLERKDFEEHLLDHLDSLVLRLEAVRHILRDAVDEDIGSDIITNGDAVRRLDEWLPSIDRPALAELLGVDPRTIQRWLKTGGGQLQPRVRVVTRLVAMLHRSWTPQGILAWFHRPRPELAGEAPIDWLSDPVKSHDLLAVARHGRASHGA
jgi:hypothetical protein